jgi:hypothetical protein
MDSVEENLSRGSSARLAALSQHRLDLRKAGRISRQWEKPVLFCAEGG